MWESPIRVLQTQIESEIKGKILEFNCKYAVDLDEHRLLEMLRGDSRSYDMGYATGKREVCERIIERLKEEMLEVLSDSGDDWFLAEQIGKAIGIVREEM